MKDILVHLTHGKRTLPLIAAAIHLAERTGARLTGLFAQADIDRVAATARQPSTHFLASAEAAAALFHDLTHAAGLRTRWWQMPHGEPHIAQSELAFCARYFDLVVISQAEPGNQTLPEEMIDQVIFNGGRPVLVLPHAGHFPVIGGRILVAWNASREVSRTVHHALPLLTTASEVTVLSLRPRSAGANLAALAALPPVDIVDHLREHAIAAQGEHLPEESIGKADMILSRACDLGADLLVMGASPHNGLSGFRESSTRAMLRTMTLPVLVCG